MNLVPLTKENMHSKVPRGCLLTSLQVQTKATLKTSRETVPDGALQTSNIELNCVSNMWSYLQEIDSTATVYSPSCLLSGTMKSSPVTQPQSFWQAQ